jgi:hypothetical protein
MKNMQPITFKFPKYIFFPNFEQITGWFLQFSYIAQSL